MEGIRAAIGNRQLVLMAAAVLYTCCGGHGLGLGPDGSQGGGGMPAGGSGMPAGGSGMAAGGGGIAAGDGAGTGASGPIFDGSAGAFGGGGSAGGAEGGPPQGDRPDVTQDGRVTDGQSVATADGACDVASLEKAITLSVGGSSSLTQCWLFTDGGFTSFGQVILDGNGKVVDNTRLSAAKKQTWLDGLANERWPCLANSTLSYTCASAG